MAILTDSYITNALGGAVKGVALYNSIAPDDAAKAQFITMADSAVVAAARRAGYTTLTRSDPSSGEAFDLLQAMSFKIWLRVSQGYVNGLEVVSGIDAALPDVNDLNTSDDTRRIDLPGLTKTLLAGEDAADMTNGLDVDNPTSAQFDTAALAIY